MSNNNLGPDIITYIGVPLTVLGILPILYNTALTLAALSKVKRMLRKSQITAMTRSDVVNRVIEIEQPRYAVKPWDRFQNRDEYWTLSRQPSSIPGGSWTTFNWKTNAIGVKTQRIEYADQLRQPQVEVALDELICYLLDLGAQPNPQGWRILRTTGQWTPVGCALLMSPDGQHKALTIAPADDSDGNLSLAVTWSPTWTARDHSSLPPYWVRLLPPPPPLEEPQPEEPLNVPSSSATQLSEVEAEATGTKSDEDKDEDLEKGLRSIKSQKSLDSVSKAVEMNAKSTITCQISVDGIVNALTEEHVGTNHSAHFNSLYIEHLRLSRLPSYAAVASGATSSRDGHRNKNAGLWFASAITALSMSSQAVLWSYKTPDDVLQFARKATIPCGVAVLLEMVNMEETPEWATQHDDARAEREAFHQRSIENHRAFQAEMKLPPAQRAEAQRERMMREADRNLKEMRDKMRKQEERADQRLMEALTSPRWDNARMSGYALEYLKKHKHVSSSPAVTLREAVGGLLHAMVLDGEFASEMADVLDLWKEWAENGGMRKSDFNVLKKDTKVWAMGVLLVSLIGDTASALEGTLAMDLQECLRIWKKVRLG